MEIGKKIIHKQYIFYLWFAILASFINLMIQKIVAWFFYWINREFFSTLVYKSVDIATLLKIFTATVIAFFFKYFVDKLFIFSVDKHSSSGEEIKRIGLYGFFAVFTTLLFWSTQLLFKVYLDLEYVGAILGLGIGYTLKFFLDRHYVFPEIEKQ